MFTLTPCLKAYAVKNLGAAEADADAKVRRIIAKALLLKKMPSEEFRKLSASAATPAAVAGKGAAAAVAAVAATAPAPAVTLTQEQVDKMVADAYAKQGGGGRTPSKYTPEMVFADDARIDVKSIADRFSATNGKAAHYPEFTRVKGSSSPGRHLFAGQPASIFGRALEHPSDRQKAVAAAFFKWSLYKHHSPSEIPGWAQFTKADAELVKYAMHEEAWSGYLSDRAGSRTRINRRKLNDYERKTLLDDTISGGIEVAPVAFDDAIILFPVLYGELFPYVNVVNVARGRRMHGASMQNPTWTSGIAEGTSIQPFNTSSFVAPFDTPIYPAVGAMELGQDWEEDSPVDLGASIIENYGLKALEYLDRVIAVGDGLIEPQGIFNASGTQGVGSNNSAAGPMAVSDLEGLMFGVQKQFRTEAGAIPLYIMNDTQYRRVRSIQVGPADERRVFGMDHGEYVALNRPVKVNNFIPDGYLAYCNMRRYRMYRRLGMTVRIETAGRSLAISNTKLIVLRMRWGGKLELGGAASVMVDAQNA